MHFLDPAMTGPDHYREAERLAERAGELFSEFVDAHDEDGDTPDVNLIRRQVEHCREMGVLHATLALAAATAINASADPPPLDWEAWREACAVALVPDS